MSFIRETASNRRVSQDALLTNLTVSDNCVLPCLDDRINSILSSQVTQISQNISSNPYLVSEVTINRDQLYNTAPTFTGTFPGGNLVFDYPSTVTTTNSQPNPNEGLITLVPAPGANKLIVPRIIEIVAPHSTLPDPSYAEGLGSNAGAPPDLIFQLWNRYPVKTDDSNQIGNQSVIGPQFEDNTPNFIMPDVKMINKLSLASISMKGGVGSTVPGLPLIDNNPANPESVDKFDFSFRVLLSSTQSFPGFEGVTLKVGSYSLLPSLFGFDYSPVNQPLTLYVDQPLEQNNGRDFTIRVHYNIVPSLD